MGVEQPTVGPPLLLSWIASTSLTVTAISKLWDPVGEDLDEEGEKWFKRSSRRLNESAFPSFNPDLSAWLPPVEQRDTRAEGKEDSVAPQDSSTSAPPTGKSASTLEA